MQLRKDNFPAANKYGNGTKKLDKPTFGIIDKQKRTGAENHDFIDVAKKYSSQSPSPDRYKDADKLEVVSKQKKPIICKWA